MNNLNAASLISLFESHMCFKNNIYIQDFKNCVLTSAHFSRNFFSLMSLTVPSLLMLQKGQKCVFLAGVASRIQLSFVPVYGAAKYPQRLRQRGLCSLQIHWDGFQGEGSKARRLLQEQTASRVRYVISETVKRSKAWYEKSEPQNQVEFSHFFSSPRTLALSSPILEFSFTKSMFSDLFIVV